MVPTLFDVLELLEKLAPSRLAEEWDNPGLQVGEPSKEIRKVLVALDPNLQALKEAAGRGAQLLLTHHPLIFRPLTCLNAEIYPGNVIFEAIQEGIAIVAAHTNLDVVPGGISDALARLFDLQEVEVLQENLDSRIPGAGLGRIGNLQKPMSLFSIMDATKALLDTNDVRVLGSKDLMIRRVAVVGGAGGGMVAVASKKGADLLVTGHISHHEALEAQDRALALIDGGHFHTEKAALRPIKDRFVSMMEDRGWNVLVEIFENENAPLRQAWKPS
ncbi:MAG: Nif3-like dinuclear metal center hexameric protein [Proteobacteria bacterium]|nr:Nif3-like dinuclear metal center hexameric protein [Pseudomonadota bacterium]